MSTESEVPEKSSSMGAVGWLQVAAGLIPPLAVNAISAELHLPFLWSAILVVAAIGVLMIAARRPNTPALEGLGLWRHQEEIILAQFALVSLVFGGVVAGVSLAPVWPSSILEVPGFAPFGNYELLAASITAGIALTSAIRRRRPLYWLVFLIAAFTGATIVMIQFAPYYTDPWLTILGWSASTALVVFAFSSIQTAIALFAWFVGFEHGPHRLEAGDERNSSAGVVGTSLDEEAPLDSQVDPLAAEERVSLVDGQHGDASG